MEINNLLPPAVVLTALVYLIKFFGKVIVDQYPFSDDREWSAEVNGISFLIKVTAGLFGIYLASISPWKEDTWALHTVTLFVVVFYIASLSINNLYLASRLFSIQKKKIEVLEKITFGLISRISDIGQRLGIIIPSVVLFYFGTLEYFSKNIYAIVFFFCNIFYIFIILALNHSLKEILKYEEEVSDIYFLNPQREVLRGVRILKVNPDNIRVRKDKKTIILNKDEVFKIETTIPEKEI